MFHFFRYWNAVMTYRESSSPRDRGKDFTRLFTGKTPCPVLLEMDYRRFR